MPTSRICRLPQREPARGGAQAGRWRLVALAFALAVQSLPAAGQQAAAPPADVFQQLNEAAVAIYQDAKGRFLAAADPVVIAGFDSVVIRHRGNERRVGQTPPEYHLLKTVGHVPRSLWAAVRPAVEGLDSQAVWRGELAALRPRIVAALDALPQAGFPPSAAARDERMLRRSLDLLDRYLTEGAPTREQLAADMRGFTPWLLADAADAARARLDAIDRDIRPWWNGLSEAERARAVVVVLGVKTSRPGNLAYSYFVNLLGPAEDGHRVIYAEGMFDEGAGQQVLATLLTDRRLASDFFADERRMERDLLADGAEARLMQLFGRLGDPEPPPAPPPAPSVAH